MELSQRLAGYGASRPPALRPTHMHDLFALSAHELGGASGPNGWGWHLPARWRY